MYEREKIELRSFEVAAAGLAFLPDDFSNVFFPSGGGAWSTTPKRQSATSFGGIRGDTTLRHKTSCGLTYSLAFQPQTLLLGTPKSSKICQIYLLGDFKHTLKKSRVTLQIYSVRISL